MANRDILAIGTSAGGVQALRFLASKLQRPFPAAILITIHLPSHFRSALDTILTSAGPLPAAFARNGDSLKKGHIHIAPPGHHLLVEGERIVLGVGPRENNAKPAIDPMLRSVAACCGSRAVGAVLTGTLGDGASGLCDLHRCGGLAVVQDPADAAFPDMPAAALNLFRPDHMARLAELPALLTALVHQPAGNPAPVPDRILYEVEIARSGRASMNGMDSFGQRSVFTCPECGGILWELAEGGHIRFRCHVGHAYAEDTMDAALDDSVARALASALRALDERIGLLRKLEHQAREQGRSELVHSWGAKAAELERDAEIIRGTIARTDAAMGTAEIAQQQPVEGRSAKPS